MLTRLSSKLRFGKLIDRIKGIKSEKVKKIEEKDFALFQSMSLLANGLNQPPLATNHPLRPFAQSLKTHLINSKRVAPLELIDLVINFSEQEVNDRRRIYVDSRLENVSELDKIFNNFQSTLRMDNLILYFQSLKKAIESAHLSPNKLQLTNILTLVDATLLGSGAERVSAHLHLSPSSLTQPELQSSFYVLYNAEIDTMLTGFRAFPGIQKSQMKNFPKAAKIYLLDTIELNTKSRCVFAWADKNYTTFQDLDDTKKVSVDDISFARLKYFDEGNSIGKQFLDSYIAEQRGKMNDRDELRQNIRLGFFFLVATCLVDWYLCTI